MDKKGIVLPPYIAVLLFLYILLGLWVKNYQIIYFAVAQNAKTIILRAAPPKIPGYKNTFTNVLMTLGEDTIPVDNGGKVIFHGPRDRKEIALTFDADMTPGMKRMLETHQVASYYNEKVIDILNQTHTEATLFLTGMWIELYPNITKSLAENKLFELGSHSYSHPSFDGTCFGLGEIPDSQDQDQIQKTQFLLQIIGGVNSKLFRFPGGCYGKNDIDIITKDGILPIQWDVAGVDGFNTDTKAIEENILNHVQNGSIIVLHMNGYPNDPKTADALPEIILKLKEEGYTFVKVSELLRETLPQQSFNFKQLISYYQ